MINRRRLLGVLPAIPAAVAALVQSKPAEAAPLEYTTSETQMLLWNPPRILVAVTHLRQREPKPTDSWKVFDIDRREYLLDDQPITREQATALWHEDQMQRDRVSPSWLVTDDRIRNRALVPKGEVLPADVTVLHEDNRPLEGVILLLVEGEHLPSWWRGCEPLRFASVAEMEAYRDGQRNAPVNRGDLMYAAGGIIHPLPSGFEMRTMTLQDALAQGIDVARRQARL